MVHQCCPGINGRGVQEYMLDEKIDESVGKSIWNMDDIVFRRLGTISR